MPHRPLFILAFFALAACTPSPSAISQPSIPPRDARALFAAANAQLDAGDFSSAKSLASQAYALDPNDKEIALLYRLTQDKITAMDYETVSATQPAPPPAPASHPKQ